MGTSARVKDLDDGLLASKPSVDCSVFESLMGIPSCTDVKTALCDIDDNKSPGSVGNNACFFEKTWHTTGESI